MGARRREAVAGLVATVLVGSLGSVLPAGPAAAVTTDQSYWVPVTKQIVVEGHGYGHGHGMSQYGAQGAALKGLSYKEIVGFYYPGTDWGLVRGNVRVLITADTSDDVVVSPVAGLSVRSLGDRSVHELPVRDDVTRWRLNVRNGHTVVELYNGQWRRFAQPWANNISGDGEFFAANPITLWTPSGARTYRGILRAASPTPGSSSRSTVNIVSMDQYVMGVVAAEMPASWAPEAVKAQAIAARTYATWSRNANVSRYYQICDTTACQVYGGVTKEDSRSNAAVQATARQILTYQGRPAFTQFSSSSGGWTSAGSVPYLTARADPYDDWSGNSVHSWSVTVDAGRLERSHPSIGTLLRVRVTSRDGNGDWQGRVNSLVLDGSKADATISGDSFRLTYGLRSTWFSIDPTPIMSRWARIGGSRSQVGDVRSGEFAVGAGSAQRFQRGRIFYSPKTGARELYGPILRTYNAAGGPQSALGFPITPVRRRGDSGVAWFQRGGIYYHAPSAPVVVTGAIDRRFLAAGGFRSGLGWPTTSNFAVPGGQRVNYEHGYIVWNRKTGATKLVRS